MRTGLVLFFSLILSFSVFSIDTFNGDFLLTYLDSNNEIVFQEDVKVTESSKGICSTIFKVYGERSSDIEELEVFQNNRAVFNKDNENIDFEITLNNEFEMILKGDDGKNIVISPIKSRNDFDYEKYYNSGENKKDKEMIEYLNKIVKNHKVYSYTDARRIMFSDTDNIDGYAECVYTGVKKKTSGIPNHNIMNCEHSWPQSKFTSKDKGAKKTDLMHIFPCDSRTNSRRGNNPYATIVKVDWEKNGSKYGYSEYGTRAFEVREEKRGDIARALFYFSVRYGQRIDENQEETLRKWHKQDPVSEEEIVKNSRIEDYQYNRNPFIDRPDFVDKISNF